MTILSTGVYSFTVSSTGHVVPAVVGSSAGALVTGVKLMIQTEPLTVALSTAVGTGTSTGAIAGALVRKTATSAGIGALIGGISAAGMGSVASGGIAMATGLLASSPLRLMTVGTSHTTEERNISQDCWKPVIGDTTLEPSKGMMLKDLVCHSNVCRVEVKHEGCLPQIFIENVWNEKYEIEYKCMSYYKTMIRCIVMQNCCNTRNDTKRSNKVL